MQNEPTLNELISARNECAVIIAQCGEQYLPIFERLEREIANHKKRQELLSRALRISSKNGTQIGTQTGTQLKLAFSAHC